jgi:hypothetical protein
MVETCKIMSYLIIHEEEVHQTPEGFMQTYWFVINPMYHFTSFEEANIKRLELEAIYEERRISNEGNGYPFTLERVRLLDLTTANDVTPVNE